MCAVEEEEDDGKSVKLERQEGKEENVDMGKQKEI